MNLYYVRHGEKETSGVYNPKTRHTDPPLTPNGFLQAKRLARYFENRDIQKIYVSRYLRTRQTAAPVAQLKRLPVIEDARIDEIDVGDTETLSYSEIASTYPGFWAAFQGHQQDVRFPGGETGEEVITRQDNFLKDVTTNNEDILVVSHDGFLRLLVCNFLGMPVYKRYLFKTDYCGLSVFEYRDEEREWTIRAYNQTVY
jgi:broad specificity phosphatase PhoE